MTKTILTRLTAVKDEIIPVVLLDEIGLAEISKYVACN